MSYPFDQGFKLGVKVPLRDMSEYKVTNNKKALIHTQPQPTYNYTIYDSRDDILNMYKNMVNDNIKNGLNNTYTLNNQLNNRN